MDPETLSALCKCRLFAGIDLNAGPGIMEMDGISFAQYERDDVICTRSDFLRRLAVMITGSANVYKNSSGDDAGSGMLMSVQKKGDIFGMASLFYESERYPADIIANDATRVMFFSKEWIRAAMKAEPRLAENYILILSEKIGFLSSRVDLLAADSAENRLLNYLISSSADKDSVYLPYSISALASSLSIARSSLYRAFDTLEKTGFISKKGREIILLNKGE